MKKAEAIARLKRIRKVGLGKPNAKGMYTVPGFDPHGNPIPHISLDEEEYDETGLPKTNIPGC